MVMNIRVAHFITTLQFHLRFYLIGNGTASVDFSSRWVRHSFDPRSVQWKGFVALRLWIDQVGEENRFTRETVVFTGPNDLQKLLALNDSREIGRVSPFSNACYTHTVEVCPSSFSCSTTSTCHLRTSVWIQESVSKIFFKPWSISVLHTRDYRQAISRLELPMVGIAVVRKIRAMEINVIIIIITWIVQHWSPSMKMHYAKQSIVRRRVIYLLQNTIRTRLIQLICGWSIDARWTKWPRWTSISLSLIHIWRCRRRG